MSTINELEAAVKGLSREELSRFRNWFFEFDAQAWDLQFEQDANTGKLDQLGEEALKDLQDGRCSNL